MTQRLHLVFGGELTDPQHNTFRDTDAIEIVSISEGISGMISNSFTTAGINTVSPCSSSVLLLRMSMLIRPLTAIRIVKLSVSSF
jgi:NRPS condensation-like uncharacterized protein